MRAAGAAAARDDGSAVNVGCLGVAMRTGILIIAGLVGRGHAQPAVPAWPGSVFYRDISAHPVHPNSSEILAHMKTSAAGGAGKASGLAWGSHTGNFQTDTSIMPLVLPKGSNKTCVAIAGAATKAQPDCDAVSGLRFPLPAQGAIEGAKGYGDCSGDCHLLVYDQENALLWESYASKVRGSVLTSACVVIWDLTKTYPDNLRGDQCTSVDAAGFPVAPLLATADEVFAGEINHAMRFALPNEMLQHGVYAHPATHAGVPIHAGHPGGAAPSPYYGMRLRLKASFSVAEFAKRPAAERELNHTACGVVFRAMQRHGIIMADGSSSHWRDCHFDDIPSASPLKHLLKVEGGAAE